MPQEGITLKKRKDAKYSNREYRKIYSKNKPHHENQNRTQERRNTGKTDKYDDRNQRYRDGNKEAMRQTQRERLKDTKESKMMQKAEKGENRRTKNNY